MAWDGHVLRQILPAHHMVFIKLCTFMFINISTSDGIMIDKKVNRGKYPCVDQFMCLVSGLISGYLLPNHLGL